MMRAAGRAIAVLAGVITVSFVLTRLVPGDPVAVLGAAPGMTPEALEALRVAAGLDRPLAVQFLMYVAALLQGDLGYSAVTGRPVATELAQRLPTSLELALAGFLPALGLAMGLGALAALRPNSLGDYLARVISGLGAALPVFVTGLLLIQLFYVGAGVAPEPSGRFDPWMTEPLMRTGSVVVDAALAGDWAVFRSALAHLALPAMTMAIFAVAPMLRVFRGAMITALAEPWVSAARHVGVSRRVVVWRYAMPQALGALIPVAAMTFGYMLGANVLVEKVFAWPGAGSYALSAMIALDHAPVQGLMLVLALVHALLSLCADLLARRLDPRLRLHV
jgi:peptide/nickel transport system permease protein